MPLGLIGAGLLAAGLGAAGNVAGGLMTNYANAKENEKNRQWNEKMWNLNNEYNTPSAILSRYLDAGIAVNPNYLVTGSYNGGQSSYAGNLDASREFKNPMQGLDGLSVYEALNNVRNAKRMTDSNVALNDSQISKNDSETNLNNTQANVNEKIAKFKETENKYQESNIILDMAKKGLENSALELTVQYTKEANPLQLSILRENVDKAKADRAISENTANLILEEIKTQEQKTRLTAEQVNTQKAETGLVHEQQRTEKSKQVANYASATASTASANYYGELSTTERELRSIRKEKLEAETFNLWRDLRTKDVENEYTEAKTRLTETEAKMLVINGILAYNRYELDKYIATVRDEWGTSTANITKNAIKRVLQASGLYHGR